MSLTPEIISRNLANNLINKKEATELLISMIENHDGSYYRAQCIEMLYKFKLRQKRVVDLVKDLLISDQSVVVREAAAKVIFYFLKEGDINILKHAIKNEKYVRVIKALMETVKDQDETMFKFLRKELANRYSKIYDVIPEEAIFFWDLIVAQEKLYQNDFYLNYQIEDVYLEKYNSFKYCMHKEDGWCYYARNGHIVALNLCGIELTELPKSISFLSKLKYLNLSANTLKELPESYSFLLKLSKLKWLNLSDITLKEVPESIRSLDSLEELILTNVRLEYAPDFLIDISKRKNAKYYVWEGVDFDDAAILGLIGMFSGLKLEKAKSDEDIDEPRWLGNYKIDNSGRVVAIYIFEFEIPSMETIPVQVRRLKCLKTLSVYPYGLIDTKSLLKTLYNAPCDLRANATCLKSSTRYTILEEKDKELKKKKERKTSVISQHEN